MWLRFHSDDNIEYEGFEGVFEFIDRPRKTGNFYSTSCKRWNWKFNYDICCFCYLGTEPLYECTFVQSNYTHGTVSNDDINQTYVATLKESQNAQIDCLWTIEVKSGWQVKFSSFENWLFIGRHILLNHIKKNTDYAIVPRIWAEEKERLWK